MSEIKNVLLAGATGNLGPAVLKELLDSNKFKVFVATRPDSKSTFPASVTVLKTDYTPTSLQTIFEGNSVDAVISNLGGHKTLAAQIALIDAAKAAGVKRYVPSEFGMDTTNAKLNEIVPIYGEKVQVAEHLKKVQSDSFTWTGVITGPFFDWLLRASLFCVKIKEKKFQKWDEGNVTFSTTNLSTVGKALVSILDSPASTANKYIYISSFNITLNELFEAVEKVTGETWTVERLDSKEAAKKAKEELMKGNFYAAYDLINVATFGLGLSDHRGAGLSNQALGLQKEDLEGVVKAVIL